MRYRRIFRKESKQNQITFSQVLWLGYKSFYTYMLKFIKFDEKHLKKIQSFTKNSEYLTCDLSAGVLYMWQNVYNSEFAIYNETLIIKCNFKNRPIYILLFCNRGRF